MHTTTPIFIDFETRSRVELRDAGGRTYVDDPSTEVMSLAAADGETRYRWCPLRGEPAPAWIWTLAATGRPFVAHNAMAFDRLVWRGAGFPEPAGGWLDSMHLARRRGLPGSLGPIGKYLYDAGKFDAGHRIMMKLTKPYRGQFIVPGRDAINLLLEYNDEDVVLMQKAWQDELSTIDLTDTESAVMRVDTEINDTGPMFDKPLAERLLVLEEQGRSQIADDLYKRTGLTPHDLRSQPKLLQWFDAHGHELLDIQKPTMRRLIDSADATDIVQFVAACRLGEAKVTSGKLKAALARLGPDGRLRDSLVYHGGHTGRWSGRGFQPQNLPRPAAVPIEDALTACRDGFLEVQHFANAYNVTVAEVFGTLLRSCIVAPEGKWLLVADYNAIECRVLNWLAGNDRALGVFRSGGDPYKEMAAPLFGVDVGQVTKPQRAMGKAIVLGCIAEGTPVLTDRGFIPIESVTADMLLWDGIEYVSHNGVVCKGVKGTLEVHGVWLTGDHLILTEQGWQPAGSFDGPPWGKCLGDGRCVASNTAKEEEFPASLLNAPVGPPLRAAMTCGTTSKPGGQPAVMPVPRCSRNKLSKPSSVPTCPNPTGSGGSTGSLQSGAAVETPVTLTGRTMGGEVFEYAMNGTTAAGVSSTIFKRCRAGMTRLLHWIESTTTGITSAGMYASSPCGNNYGTRAGMCGSSTGESDTALKILPRCSAPAIGLPGASPINSGGACLPVRSSSINRVVEARTYDIVNAGPRNRFQAGKLIVHNCGYGLGKDKFATYALSYGVDWSKLDITPAKCIETYRNAHPEIAGTPTGSVYLGHIVRQGGLWKNTEKAMKDAITQGIETTVGRCTWFREGQHVYCRLPSGRCLIYRNAAIEKRVPSWGGEPRDAICFDKAGAFRESTYGGKLVENCTQSVARDLLADSLVKLAVAGLNPVLHVHDEIICEVEDAGLLDRMERIMTTAPWWAHGLPLVVEGAAMRRWGKP